MTLVPPEALMPGDSIVIGNQVLTVKVVDGPDHLETYDLYLTGASGDCHKIVRDAVEIVHD